MTEAHLVNCTAPNYRLTIILDRLPDLPLVNIRRILRMARVDPNNDEVLSKMRAFGISAEQTAKDAWKSASEEFVHGYKKVLAKDRRPASIKQRAINRKLLAEVKKTKAAYERWRKINQLIIERK